MPTLAKVAYLMKRFLHSSAQPTLLAVGTLAMKPVCKIAVQAAKHHGVKIGAHPSFVDRENFGRSTMHPPLDELYQQLKTQIQDLTNIAHSENMQLSHVKPHGALYNQAAQDLALAEVLVKAIKDCDPSLKLMGLAQSPLIKYAQSQGVSTIEEAFSDRRYHLNGSLVSRQNPLGCITDGNKSHNNASH